MAHIGFYKQADQDLQALSKQRRSADNEALGWKSSLYYTSGMADTTEHHYSTNAFHNIQHIFSMHLIILDISYI